MKTKFNKVSKIIRSDQGKEYVNKELKSYFQEEGIEHQDTVAYSPEQNGTAERKNRYLVEMTRCMLIDAKLPNKYWREAVNTANYLQNRLITRATNKTPYEVWNKRKPDLTISHIQVFGAKVYAHIPKINRK